jgi:hypothetical protein
MLYTATFALLTGVSKVHRADCPRLRDHTRRYGEFASLGEAVADLVAKVAREPDLFYPPAEQWVSECFYCARREARGAV